MKRSEKFYFILILSITLIVWVKARVTDAESLWLKGEQESFYADSKAKKKGDTVTVIISESSQASQKSSTKRAKDIGLNGAPDAAKAGKANLLSFLPFTGVKAKSSFNGAGATTRTGLLNAMITVDVTEVMANGNLVIDGKRKLKINGDVEEISISGIVRPQDITSQNTVFSACISNAQIKYRGEAELTGKERPGVIGRMTNRIANIFF